MTLRVTLLSPERPLFEGQASIVVFPGERGIFEVLPFHRPLLSRLVAGQVIVERQAFPIRRGVAKVERNIVTAVVELA